MNNPPARSFFNADDLSLLIMEHPDAPQFLAVKIADEHDAAMAQSRARIEALESRQRVLQEALEPFACRMGGFLGNITDADVERARAALAGDAP